MVVVLNRNIKNDDKKRVREFLEKKGFVVREIVGEEETIFGAVGLIPIDKREVETLSGVERVVPITKPYKLASREFKKDDTVISIGGIKIGGSRIVVIAGPCAVESREQILESARIVRESGAVILRGGAYKPRTSPYAFQGLEEDGLRFMKEAGEKEGLPIVTEIVDPGLAEMMADYVDIFQVGARNMQNFELLKKVGSIKKPVILKRGLSSTIQEWLMAAEYILAHGAEDVILCERGIRTFETYTRNTLDISAIPVIKKLSHLPVIVDPSHATGIRDKVPSMALASVAAGAHGLMVEVHPNPDKALSDGPQSLYPEQLEKLMRDIEALSPVIGKEVAHHSRKFREIYSVSDNKKDDKKTRIAFQGERGAYSEKALFSYFQNDNIMPLPVSSFGEVFSAVLKGSAGYGILPLENSLAGSIHQNYDLLLQYPDIRIVGEKKIRISHNLMVLPGVKPGSIKYVYSHPQGLAQCSVFLDKHPEWERVPFYDTAGSAAFIAKNKRRDCAAIAGIEAAEVYKMDILEEGIETNPRNYTRFVIICREDQAETETGANKASLIFSIPHKPGALFYALKILADNRINMKKLESRPIQGSPWEYMFYVDVEIPDETAVFEKAVSMMKAETEDFRILGMYRT